MSIIFSAVLDGLVTGQTNTSNYILSALRKKHNVVVNLQPEKGWSFPVKFLIYLTRTAYLYLFYTPKTSYLMLNRTVQSFWLRDCIVILFSILFSEKIFIHIVGNDFPRYFSSLNWIGRKIFQLLIAKIDVTYVVLGESMKTDLLNAFEGTARSNFKTIIFPGFISEAEEALSDKHFKVKSERNSPVVIGYMSNLIPEKGIFEFCGAVRSLREKYSNLSFWVAGKKMPGVDYRELDDLIARNYVSYSSFLSGDNKWGKLSKTDVFILPTYYTSEFLPLSIIEALYSGCIVISCDTGEISNYINETNGLIVEKKSATHIADGVSLVINTLHSYDKEKIRNDISKVLLNFKSIFFQLI